MSQEMFRVQPTAGSELPHTRARAVHWLATAAALAAATGAAALVQPPGATASPATPSEGPDPLSATYPLDCADHGIAVTAQESVDLDGDGRAETVAVVQCDAGTGSPPGGLYVLAPAADDGPPRLAETLVDPADDLIVDDLSVDGDTVTAHLLGYSASDVPRCCPDQQGEVSWQWRDGALLRDQDADAAIADI